MRLRRRRHEDDKTHAPSDKASEPVETSFEQFTPSDLEAVLERKLDVAEALAQAGDLQGAAAAFAEVSMAPDSDLSLFARKRLAYILVRQHRYDEAEAQYRKVVGSDNRYRRAGAAAELGQLLYQLGRVDEAIPIMQIGLEWEDSNFYGPGCFRLGVALEESGRFEEALDYFALALEKSDVERRSEIQLHTANSLDAIGRTADAERIYAEMAASGGSFKQVAKWSLGRLLGQRGETEAARRILTEVREHGDPEAAIRATLYLAELAEHNGQIEEATRLYRIVTDSPRLAPATEANHSLARMLETSAPADAELFYKAAVKADNVEISGQAKLDYARFLASSGRASRAEKIYQELIDSGHWDLSPAARINLAGLYLARKKYSRAEELLKTALEEAAPARAVAGWMSLARLNIVTGRLQEAESILDDLQPSHPELAAPIALRRAWIRLADDRDEEAVSLLNLVISLGEPETTAVARETLKNLRAP